LVEEPSAFRVKRLKRDLSTEVLMAKSWFLARLVSLAAILALAVYVVFSPSTVYAPVPKIALYTLLSLLPAILLGAEAASRFEFKLPGFIFVTGGSAGLFLFVLLFLTSHTKPEQQIAVFRIFDENNQPVGNLDRTGAVEVPLTDNGLSITKLVDGNAIVLIFPEQVGECELRIKPMSLGKVYVGRVSYSGTRESRLSLGKQLKSD
jgi:hypothetical protein